MGDSFYHMLQHHNSIFTWLTFCNLLNAKVCNLISIELHYNPLWSHHSGIWKKINIFVSFLVCLLSGFFYSEKFKHSSNNFNNFNNFKLNNLKSPAINDEKRAQELPKRNRCISYIIDYAISSMLRRMYVCKTEQTQASNVNNTCKATVESFSTLPHLVFLYFFFKGCLPVSYTHLTLPTICSV